MPIKLTRDPGATTPTNVRSTRDVRTLPREIASRTDSGENPPRHFACRHCFGCFLNLRARRDNDSTQRHAPHFQYLLIDVHTLVGNDCVGICLHINPCSKRRAHIDHSLDTLRLTALTQTLTPARALTLNTTTAAVI
jgi:hypothetical protein